MLQEEGVGMTGRVELLWTDKHVLEVDGGERKESNMRELGSARKHTHSISNTLGKGQGSSK